METCAAINSDSMVACCYVVLYVRVSISPFLAPTFKKKQHIRPTSVTVDIPHYRYYIKKAKGVR